MKKKTRCEGSSRQPMSNQVSTPEPEKKRSLLQKTSTHQLHLWEARDHLWQPRKKLGHSKSRTRLVCERRAESGERK